MTYKEKLNQLYSDYEAKEKKYLAYELEYSKQAGFGDSQEINDFAAVKAEWQHASNEFHNLNIYCEKMGIDVNNEIFLG